MSFNVFGSSLHAATAGVIDHAIDYGLSKLLNDRDKFGLFTNGGLPFYQKESAGKLFHQTVVNPIHVGVLSVTYSGSSSVTNAPVENGQFISINKVLPSIRKTGGYMTTIPNETPEETMARALMIAKDKLIESEDYFVQNSDEAKALISSRFCLLKFSKLFQQVCEWLPIERVDRFARAAIHQWQQLFCQMQQSVIVY